MRHIDMSSPEDANMAATFYLAESASDRLLLVMEAGPSSHDDVATLAEAMTDEGWNILHLAVTKIAGATAVATAINHTLSRATSRLASTSTRPWRIVAVADGAAALSACLAVLQSHRQENLPTIGGIVTVDAFASTPATNEISNIAAELAQLDTLVTLIAARRSSPAARRGGMSYHQLLQANGRETHFVVLAENGLTLFQQVADARDPFGREVRWLLDPVHSRNVA
jgi:hypothetical protein